MLADTVVISGTLSCRAVATIEDEEDRIYTSHVGNPNVTAR